MGFDQPMLITLGPFIIGLIGNKIILVKHDGFYHKLAEIGHKIAVNSLKFQSIWDSFEPVQFNFGKYMASTSSKAFWAAGTPLRDAWLVFAPHDQRAEYERAPGFLVAMNALLGSNIDATDGSKFVNAIGRAVIGGNEASSRRAVLESELREVLLDKLFENQLVATGYREAPTRSRAPVTIDESNFESPDVDWANSIISANGISYNRVRIAAPKAIKGDIALGRRKGRPGSGAAIRAAIDQLIEDDPGFCELSRKVASKKICDYLGVEPQKGNGLSDINLAKLIREKCGTRIISEKS